MSELRKILEGEIPAGASARERVDSLLAQWPWFTAARAVRAYRTGRADALLDLLRSNRRLSSLARKSVDLQMFAKESEGEIIDRFLRLDNYRIVADEEGEDGEIRTEAELDEADDLVSEELAEVFAAQGLVDEAVEIYRKLSLLNTEKSVYFAEKIRNLTE